MGCFIFGGGGGKGDSSLDFSQVNMEPQYALAGKKFYNKDKELKAGTILNWDGTPLTLADGETISGADVVEPSLTTRYIPSGKYLGKPVFLAPMAQGSVDVRLQSNTGFLVDKTAGYISGGTDAVAFPPGKVLADGTYEGPYAVTSGSEIITLNTSGKYCTGDITVGKTAIFIGNRTPNSSTTMYLPYQTVDGAKRKPMAFSIMGGMSATSGDYLATLMGLCATDGTYDFPGTFNDGGQISTFATTITDQPASERIKLTITDNYGFKSTVSYYVMLIC